MVACMPESPRWLCLKEPKRRSSSGYCSSHGKPVDSDEVVESLQLIIGTVAHEKNSNRSAGARSFSNGEQQTFRRNLLGCRMLAVPADGWYQRCCVLPPVILTQSFGFSNQLALILTAVDFISLMIWGSVVMLVIDRWGRRKLMLLGCFRMGCSFTVAVIGLALKTKSLLCDCCDWYLCLLCLFRKSLPSSR